MANPIPNYSSDPAERTFRSCIPLLSQNWVYSFLMSPPEVYHSQLQQSILQPRRVTAEMIIATTTPAEELELNECIRFLLLPSFSTGPVTVGYQVTEYVTTVLGVAGKPYVSKCVRDDDNGSFLTIAELPGDVTEITFCVQHSPGFREHVFMILHTPTFNNVLTSLGEGRGYDKLAMKDALIYSFQSCELRECPSCGARSVTCTCPRTRVRKQHAMDFEGDLANLSSFMGDYEGMSYQAIYQQGVTLFNGMYSTRAAIDFSWDVEGRRRLETWALQDSLRGRDVNLVKMVMPNPGSRSPLLTNSTFNNGKRSLSWNPFTDDVCAAATIEQFIADDRDIHYLPELGSICTPHESRRSYTATTTQARATADNKEIHTDSIPTSMSDACSQRFSSPHNEQPQEKSVQMTSPQPPAMAVTSETPMTAYPISSNAMNNEQVVRQQIPLFNSDAITRPKRIGRPPAPKIQPVTRLVPIVPATEAATAAGVQKAIDSFSEEARRKIELRKARNRASAIRSNEKKKQQMQELKDGLEEAKKEEAALRAKERSLREANLALRAKIAK